MIKSDKGHIEIKGVGADIIAEFGELVSQLYKAGIPEEVIVRTTAIALTMTEHVHEDESDDNAADESDDDFEQFRHMFGDLFHE